MICWNKMKSKTNYECCRCGYSAYQKSAMRLHLYSRKTVCPAIKEDIELTEYVKNYILQNKAYRVSSQQVVSSVAEPKLQMNNSQNTQYVIQQFAPHLSSFEKLKAITKYTNVEVINLFNHIEKKFIKEISKFQNHTYKDTMTLKFDDFITCVHVFSKDIRNDLSTLNILFDDEGVSINILNDDDSWIDPHIEQGVVFIVTALEIMYLREYEKYILRELVTMPDNQHRQKVKEALYEYYKFITCFNIPPYCKHSDDYILYDCDASTHDICDEFEPLYVQAIKEVSSVDKNKTLRKVLSILKGNSTKYVKKMNNNFANLISNNDDFQHIIKHQLEY